MADKTRAEAAVHYLTGLLHYHERITMGVMGTEMPDGTLEVFPYEQLLDGYADALREAIRCVKQVNDLA